MLARARGLEPEPADVVLDYADSGKNIAILEPLRGRSGWLACAHVSMTALESEDQLVFAGVTDEGEAIDQAQCRRLFDLPAAAGAPRRVPDAVAAELEQTLLFTMRWRLQSRKIGHARRPARQLGIDSRCFATLL